jgi:hypothetical protein
LNPPAQPFERRQDGRIEVRHPRRPISSATDISCRFDTVPDEIDAVDRHQPCELPGDTARLSPFRFRTVRFPAPGALRPYEAPRCNRCVMVREVV